MNNRLGRRHAPPMLAPTPGLPLIRSVPNLGYMQVWRKGRSVVPADMPDDQKKKQVYKDFQTFVAWMNKEDGAIFKGQVRVEGPIPHFAPKPPDVQVGDRGGTRPVARNLVGDSTTDEEDYIIHCLFEVREQVAEVPTSVALDLFGKGSNAVRPARGFEWKQKGSNQWLPRD